MDDLEFKFDDDNTFDFDNGNGGEDDIKLVKTKKRLPLKKKKSVQFKQQQQRPPPPPPPRQHNPQPRFDDNTFAAFSNPSKQNPEPDEDDEPDEDNSIEGSDMGSAPESDIGDDPGFNGEPEPSPGFASLEDEKQDLLYKFHRLETRGVKLAKKFNMYSDIRDMRAEFQKIKRDSEVNSSIKFSRQMLMMVVNATEFLNKRYDPFGFELDGWSSTVNENLTEGDYDNIFERLHDKYAGRVNTPPEIELMLSLAGSAVMFHMTSSMFKSVPNISEMARNNPDIQKAMKTMAEGIMKSQSGAQPSAGSDNEADTYQADGRREMKGPSLNLSSLSGFGSVLPPPMPSSMAMERPPPAQPVRAQDVEDVPESLISDSASEMSGMSVKQVSVVTEGGTRRGRKPKISATKANTIDI